MPIANSVVTPARFAQGLSYRGFLEQAAVNRDRFEQYYQTSPLSEEDLLFFRKTAAVPHGVANILAVGEAWCGDVYRELPTIARIAEATGVILRIFLRDENPDIMDEFLSDGGKARAIPVFVFYTSGMMQITRFIERPATAQTEIDALLNAVKGRLKLPLTATFTHLPEAAKQEVIAKILPRFVEWQKDFIKEMRELLSSALKLPNE